MLCILNNNHIKYKSDGLCLQNTLYFLSKLLKINVNQIEYINSIRKMLNFFNNSKYEFYIYIPTKYIFTPFTLKILKYHKKIIFDKQKILNIILKRKKYAIIHYVSAYEFYEINEYWTHFILEAQIKERRYILDTFYTMYKSEYIFNIDKLYNNKLKSMKNIQIIILDKI